MSLDEHESSVVATRDSPGQFEVVHTYGISPYRKKAIGMEYFEKYKCIIQNNLKRN